MATIEPVESRHPVNIAASKQRSRTNCVRMARPRKMHARHQVPALAWHHKPGRSNAVSARCQCSKSRNDDRRSPCFPARRNVLAIRLYMVRWAPHAVHGWYLGPAMKGYRCYRVWIGETSAERVSDTIVWLPSSLWNLDIPSTLPQANSAVEQTACAWHAQGRCMLGTKCRHSHGTTSPVEATPFPHAANAANPGMTIADRLAFQHAAMCSPSVSTWCVGPRTQSTVGTWAPP